MTRFSRARVLAFAILLPGSSLAAGSEAVTPPPPATTPPAAPAAAGQAAPGPAAPASPAPAAAAEPAKPAPALNETQKYCQNIAAAAADARFAWQRKQLNDLDAQIKQRIADLESREAALKQALAHRDDMMKRAADTVVAIYAKMKPDAAALQLAALDDDVASSILAQLTQKQASSILSEIPSGRAAKLVTAITSIANNAAADKKS